MSEKSERVVAVVVAYNRAALLVEALEGLLGQTRPLDSIVVVDNASDDDTAAVVGRVAPDAELVRLTRNTGGAGGFAVGTAVAVLREHADLVWLMDDDTVPTPTALAELLDARDRHPDPLAVLASRVVWTDGRDHPMNVPRARPLGGRRRRAAEAVGLMAVRSASFVSFMVDARVVRRLGLPIAEYFIWNDDFEYSTRLLRRGDGVYVPRSVVVHKTKVLGSTDADPGARFYYEVRNKIWMFRHARTFGPLETLLYGGSTLRRWVRTLRRSSDRSVLRDGFRRGWRDGFARSPRLNAEALADQAAIAPEIVDPTWRS
ncbi:glycosyltransferase family 2 protein [Schumannella soli]|uniref:Glycosyltransferase n=1 Tax=Schumannella soli TaxID=2590779 RepID=A0A506Y5D5_9MICO|nr:glycosyltransferase family 2 protein [Schumannella soli]TPW77235.1 glycosyltransferase [Schumannella soli]